MILSTLSLGLKRVKFDSHTLGPNSILTFWSYSSNYYN